MPALRRWTVHRPSDPATRRPIRVAGVEVSLLLALAVVTLALSTGPSQSQVRTPSQVQDYGINPPSGSKLQEEEFRRAHAAYVRGDYDTAIRIWNQLADQGHIKSMNNLGAMYSQGKVVSRNYPLARFWYRRAADAGGPRANYNLGLLYEYGRGVEPSDAEAAKFYRTAAKLGVIDAMDALAWLLATSPDNTVRDGHEARLWANYSLARQTNSRSLVTLAAV